MMNTNITRKPAHLVLIFALIGAAVLALAACGGITGTDTGAGAAVQPASTATADMSAEMSSAPTPQATTAADSNSSATDPVATQATGTQSAPGTTGTTEVQAVLKEWSIELSQQEVPAGKIRFTVTNQGQMAHNFTVTDDSGVIGNTPTFRSSEGAHTLEVDLKPGTYTIICSLPGHAARGQKTTLTVK